MTPVEEVTPLLPAARFDEVDDDDDDERYRWTMKVASIGIAHVSLDGRYLEVNPTLCRLLGYSEKELLELTVWDTSHPEDRSVTKEAREQLHSGEIDSFAMEKRYVRKDGRFVWFQIDISVRRDATGAVLYDIAVMQDISARKKAETQLQDSERRFKNLASLMSDWYWETDAEGRITRIDGSTAMVARPQLVGSTGDEAGLVAGFKGHSLAELQRSRAPFQDQVFVFQIGDEKVHLVISGRPVFHDDRTFLGYQGAARDITNLIEAEERVRFLASHDVLTGLPNRETFHARLSHALVTAAEFGESVALAFIDLDDFKVINDTLGHTVGDKLLRKVSTRLCDAVRSSDVVARFGGDEFVVMIQGCRTSGELGLVAKKLMEAVSGPIQLGDHECRVSASIGLARFPHDGTSVEAMLKNADLAMYVAKESGKNNYRFFDDALAAESEARLAIETRLRNAVENNELSLTFQTRFDPALDRVSGVVAQLRWNNPSLGKVDPDSFLPIAEQTGLMVPIGRWVLNEACEKAARWPVDGNSEVVMSVNLSRRQFNSSSLLTDIETALAGSDLEPHLLELEVIESILMSDPDRALDTLKKIKALGVRIAVTDFGSGYGALARFPIDAFKVKSAFGENIAGTADKKATIDALVAISKTFQINLVTEI